MSYNLLKDKLVMLCQSEINRLDYLRTIALESVLFSETQGFYKEKADKLNVDINKIIVLKDVIKNLNIKSVR